MLLFFLSVIWVTGALVGIGFVGTRVHQCLHPHHHRSVSLSFDPKEVKALDLFVVAGSISVHSCPYVKNITIDVSEAAHSHELLQSMNVQFSSLNGVVRLHAMGPTFDFHKCQLSHIKVLVPSTAILDLSANVITGFLKVGESRFRNARLVSSLGYIKSHHLTVQERLEVDVAAGYVELQDTASNVSRLLVQTGLLDIHQFSGVETVAEMEIGCLHSKEIASHKSLSMLVDLGAMCINELAASKETLAVVGYGFLRIKPATDYCYSFVMETEWGNLNVVHKDEDHKPHYVAETHKHKSGKVGRTHTHSNILVSTKYGSVSLVTDKVAVVDKIA
jgi:hypothetical protein